MKTFQIFCFEMFLPFKAFHGFWKKNKLKIDINFVTKYQFVKFRAKPDLIELFGLLKVKLLTFTWLTTVIYKMISRNVSN